MKLWAYTVDIYERMVGSAYPVVSHVFYGKTQAEAYGYYTSHLRTDAFLRGCVTRGRWSQVDCHAVAEWSQVR